MNEQARYYVTTSIPYVNGEPHIGFALEAVQADVLARFARQRGDEVRSLSGTDENALTNVQAAEREGISTAALVERNAARFAALRGPLALSWDDFIRTSRDPRLVPGAQKLWRACVAAGDVYKRHYTGLYCVRCERFYRPDELIDGRCPIHGIVPEQVDEENYFFRLSRYESRLHELIASDALRVQPEHRKAEVLAFIGQGLADFSISRAAARGRGWGVPVPDDPAQVMYVWVDALSNYISALDYATDGPLFQRFWLENPRRVHVIGKDILRFHAVDWPALLLSAGLPVPTMIDVHEFLTLNGERISKSRGNTVDPVALASSYGADALRYWLLREMPRTSDGDFTVARLVERYERDLANDLGNLVNRVVSMVGRYRGGRVPAPAGLSPSSEGLRWVADDLPAIVADTLDRFDFRAALEAIWLLVGAANRAVDERKPWELARAARAGDGDADRALDAVLAELAEAVRLLAWHLTPFIPDGAAAIADQLGLSNEELTASGSAWGTTLPGRMVRQAAPVFPRQAVAVAGTG
jgi:methionyl-tRNA synthetase